MNLFAVAAAVLLVSSSAAAAPPAREYRPGELVVKFRSDDAMRCESLHGRHGARVLKRFGPLRMEHVRLPDGKDPAEAARDYLREPEVEYAEPNYLVHAATVPTDALYYRQWALPRIGAPAAWDLASGSAEVTVAVIDSGIDYDHPDLRSNLWVNGAEAQGRPGVDDDGNGVTDDIYGFNAIAGNGDPRDDDSHGTHVAGIIGASGNNGYGVSGVNWKVKIMSCKFLDAAGTGSVSDAIACLQYVRKMKERGVNVVATNNSWGGINNSRALSEAINAGRDILFIAAAGNESSDNDSVPSYPAGYDLPNVLSVAATTSSDQPARFSNTGKRSVHLGAPGDSIVSTLPGGTFGSMSGTSMAAPYVSGLAALVKSARPGLEWKGIRNLLLSSGERVAPLEEATITGRRVDAYSALACTDSRQLSPLKYDDTPQPGVPVPLAALSVNCSAASGPVSVTLSDGETVLLQDDGIYPDAEEGDGIFAALFTPRRTPESYTFSSPAGSVTVGRVQPAAGSPLAVASSLLPEGMVRMPYRAPLAASGGTAPYRWSIAGGKLPAGVSLDEASGTLSGSPRKGGAYPFTAAVTDAAGTTVVATVTLTIAPPRANLTVRSVAGPPAASPGQKVKVRVMLENTGSASSRKGRTRLYLRPAGTAGEADVAVKEVATSSIGAKRTRKITMTLRLPLEYAGSFVWFAASDVTSASSEISETDNGAAGNEVLLSPAPGL